MAATAVQNAWPELDYGAWKDTIYGLHMRTQIIGKIRLVKTPWVNHSWNVPLYVTARGLTTSPMADGDRSFQIDFDFIDHAVKLETSDGARRQVALRPQSIAAFHDEIMTALRDLGIAVKIYGVPNELPDPIPFREDRAERPYDADYANRFWRVLLQADRLFTGFRACFVGKCSPVHFFWGSFDLAVTRFSGRTAPPHPGGVPHLPDAVTREAYSHEVSSAGFWPGGGPVDYAAFYSYAYPTPIGFNARPVEPAEAFFHDGLGEFLLPYDAVRKAADPDDLVTRFLQSTYAAAAETANWDRAALERLPVRP
jgi:hypothetical protein